MEYLHTLLNLLLHLDEQLMLMIQNYGVWVYAILFLIIFVETGLVVMPFLPGDSLLFAAGAFAAGLVNKETGELVQLNLWVVLGLLLVAAVLGDALNYFLGKRVGLRMLQFKIGGKQLVKQKYIDQTHEFFDKHGPKTIIIARFVPIVRTFAPFVAGIGNMKYGKFIRYNFVGAFVWVFGLTLVGYFFGTMDFVQENFELVIFGIIGISLVPMIFELVKGKINSKKAA